MIAVHCLFLIVVEKRKKLAGELYLANDLELAADRKRALRLIRIYNAITEEESKVRSQILEELFCKVGKKVELQPPFRCDYGSNICIGNNLYMNYGCVILDHADSGGLLPN